MRTPRHRATHTHIHTLSLSLSLSFTPLFSVSLVLGDWFRRCFATLGGATAAVAIGASLFSARPPPWCGCVAPSLLSPAPAACLKSFSAAVTFGLALSFVRYTFCIRRRRARRGGEGVIEDRGMTPQDHRVTVAVDSCARHARTPNDRRARTHRQRVVGRRVRRLDVVGLLTQRRDQAFGVAKGRIHVPLRTHGWCERLGRARRGRPRRVRRGGRHRVHKRRECRADQRSSQRVNAFPLHT